MQVYKQIIDELRAKRYKPVYLLMGDESYYIDKLADFFQNNVINEKDRDFNLTVLYGDKLNDYVTVAEAAMRPPMMADRQLVLVKEAQMIGAQSRNPRKKDLIDLMLNYVQRPLLSTILVICYKDGKIDKRKKVVGEISRRGLVFESDKIKDYQVNKWIKEYIYEQGLVADDKSIDILGEHLGIDLSRIVTEVDKLKITLPKNSNIITVDQIEKNIGFSKEFNNIELVDAVLKGNVEKATRIGIYFAQNQKVNNIISTIAFLFGLFRDLLLVNYTQDKGDASIARRLGKPAFVCRSYREGIKRYNAWKCMQNIAFLRQYDGKSKGIDSNEGGGELLKELIFKLMH